MALAVLAAACSAPARPDTPPELASPASLTARGDWDDVDAALEVALTRAQMALIRRTPDGPDLLRYELITIGNQPAALTVSRAPSSGGELIDIRLEARVGRFGDPHREAELLEPLADRLRQLAGVDYAPLSPR